MRHEGTPIYDWGYVSGTRRTVLNDFDGGYYGSNEFREAHSKFFEGKLRKGEEVYYKEKLSERSHSIFLLPMISETMNELDIDFEDIKNIVAVNGPGSFTGIRIGLSVAKTISYAKNIPVYLVSSLASMLVSCDVCEDKIAIIVDSKGYFICVFDKKSHKSPSKQ